MRKELCVLASLTIGKFLSLDDLSPEMIIAHKKQLILLCPPKTGTTSLRGALKDKSSVDIFSGRLIGILHLKNAYQS